MIVKKQVWLAGIGIAWALSATGCADTQVAKADAAAPMETLAPGAAPDRSEADENTPAQEPAAQNTTVPDTADTDDFQADTENAPADSIADMEIIGGKVRSIDADSFVISRTLIDAEGYVKMPEAGSPEEQLVTIRCTDSTVFELWKIPGGGAGIETSEAAFSDLAAGSGLEAEGYFDGEEFAAEKVIIEIYQ